MNKGRWHSIIIIIIFTPFAPDGAPAAYYKTLPIFLQPEIAPPKKNEIHRSATETLKKKGENHKIRYSPVTPLAIPGKIL